MAALSTAIIVGAGIAAAGVGAAAAIGSSGAQQAAETQAEAQQKALDLQQQEFWPFLGFTAGSFWLLFDPILNLMRGKSLFYIGTNSQIDKFGLKYPILYWGLKIVTVGITIYSFIVLTK